MEWESLSWKKISSVVLLKRNTIFAHVLIFFSCYYLDILRVLCVCVYIILKDFLLNQYFDWHLSSCSLTEAGNDGKVTHKPGEGVPGYTS